MSKITDSSMQLKKEQSVWLSLFQMDPFLSIFYATLSAIMLQMCTHQTAQCTPPVECVRCRTD